MGNAHPDLVASGRIVQGYSVSGPLDGDAIAAVNRDLTDETWRSEFHASLLNDRRFQRGLFNLAHGVKIGPATVPGPAALLRLVETSRKHRPFSLQELQRLSARQLSLEEGYDYEYGLGLVKTSAALVYTIRLSLHHGLIAVTDSEGHFRLLERTCMRDQVSINNRWIAMEMY